jgi:phosphoenolpyruvate---glycerone phosphotransferase subunit DhaL
MMTGLSLPETVELLLHVADRVIAARDRLTEADRLGDGDHGVGMARGFEAAQLKLGGVPQGSIADAFKVTGTALIAGAGGAAGAVFGTLFRAGAAALERRERFDADALAAWLEAGLAAVKQRGGAAAGDKTMIDSLEPAARAAAAARGGPLAQALAAAAEAAREGVERTRDMVARAGKMRSLGPRSLGAPDPGAVSMHVILDAMREAAAGA